MISSKRYQAILRRWRYLSCDRTGGSVEISRAWSRAEWTFLHFFARDEPTVPHFPKPFSLVINVYTYDESTRIDRSIEGNKGER